jgi:hypothetical protein
MILREYIVSSLLPDVDMSPPYAADRTVAPEGDEEIARNVGIVDYLRQQLKGSCASLTKTQVRDPKF